MNRQYGALSGLAMVLIVLNHAVQFGVEYSVQAGYAPGQIERYVLTFLQAFGVLAVPIFLFISGSFITYAARGSQSTLSVRFIWNSVRHVLWPYVIWSLIFYVLIFFTRDMRFGPLGYVKNLLVGYPYHFIPLLVLYYIAAPFLVLLSKRFAWLLLVGIGLYQIFLILVRDGGQLGFALPAWTQWLTPPVVFNTMADWAIYFPMGLVFALKAKEIRPFLQKWRWLFTGLVVVSFVVGLLSYFGWLNAAWARYLTPFFFMFLMPVINRNSIPQVRHWERVGKKSYGVYLTHFIVLELILFAIAALVPAFFNLTIVLYPLLLGLGLMIPLWVMEWAQKGPTRKVYKYIFG
jgi:peptidoglycan/LPS O-acetylase OafA/YrhL